MVSFLKAINVGDDEQLGACKILILSNGIVNPLLVFVYDCGMDDVLQNLDCYGIVIRV